MADLDSMYRYLTDLVIGELQNSGSESLLQTLQTPDLAADASSEISSEIFTELLLAFQDGKLQPEHILAFLDVAITDDEKAASFAQVFDVFPLTDSLRDLLTKISEANAIQPTTYAQFIGLDSIVQAGIVPKDTLFRQLNTRKRDEFYTQKKYNLLYEEFEGYSKLINEFFLILSNPENEFEISYAINVVEQLMGHYQLDPNRVLDVLLEVFSDTIVGNHRFMINFLKLSRWWPTTESDCSSLSLLSLGGCDQAAKLIGLKILKHDKTREFAETFKNMIAILIKEGFLSFGAIYKYSAASPATMEMLEEKYKKDLEEKVLRASASALALAAPLLDDEAEADGAAKPATNQVKVPVVSLEDMLKHNFEVLLLKSCLSIGLYWPSIYILSNYPFLAYVDSEVQELMTRLVNAIISPLYDLISAVNALNISVFEGTRPIALSRAPNQVQLEDSPNTLLYCIKSTAREFGNRKLVYFYTEWSEKLPKVEKVDDLILVSKEFLKFLGPFISSNIEVFQKICELIAADLASDSSDERLELWFNYYRNYILPAVCAIEENPIPVDKAYAILKFFKPEDRYNIYGELHQVLAKNNPHVKICYGKAEKNTKDLLKRLSKENVDQMMRRLAKISYSNPLPCFLTILQQIESYDNLNSLVVETAKYFSEYGWDNLTLAILMRLTASGRSNVQADGLNERQWIQSLASFIGKICSKYPDSVDLSTIVQYLLKSFHSNETAGLIVLKEMLSSMGGIQAITNLTPLQINMINCGSCMEKVVYRTIGDERFEKTKSGAKLCSTICDLDVLNELLVLLCRTNRNIVSGEEFSHLKALGNKIDEVDAVTRLLCTLVTFFGGQDAASHLLSIGELVNTYKAPFAWAFEIWRGNLDNEKLAKVKTSIDANVLGLLSLDLFVAFWNLKLYDLNYSAELYDTELEKLQAKIVSLKENIAFSRREKDVPVSRIQFLRDELSQTEKFASEIPTKKEEHAQHSSKVSERIKTEFTSWCTADQDFINKFVELCVLPRALHSSFDAIYTAQFLFFLHTLSTPNYSLLGVLSTIFNGKLLFGTLFTCTSTEAENLGLFVSELFKVLNTWTKQEEFEKQDNSAPFVDTDLKNITFSEFKSVVFHFHTNVLENISESLHVVDYMSRHNAITFLKNLLGVYPTVEDHCESVVELIENISRRETRDDLKLSSNALIGHVKSRSASWVHIWDFIDMPEEEKAANVARRQKIDDERKKAIEAAKQKEQAKREAERKKLEQERLARLEKEKAAQQQQASANALNYNESSTRTERGAVRGNEPSRGRYDNYSTGSRDSSSRTTSGISTPRTPSGNGNLSLPSVPTSKTFNPPTAPGSTKTPSAPQASAPSGPRASQRDSSSDDLFKLKSRPRLSTPVNTSALKSKLQEARNARNTALTVPKSPAVPAKPVENAKTRAENARTRAESAKVTSASAAPLPPPPPRTTSAASAQSARRAPLPPQQAPRDSRGFNQRRYSLGSSASLASLASLAPLPPPSLPPPKNPPPKDRRDNKRRYDSGRGYDKRQRY